MNHGAHSFLSNRSHKQYASAFWWQYTSIRFELSFLTLTMIPPPPFFLNEHFHCPNTNVSFWKHQQSTIQSLERPEQYKSPGAPSFVGSWGSGKCTESSLVSWPHDYQFSWSLIMPASLIHWTFRNPYVYVSILIAIHHLRLTLPNPRTKGTSMSNGQDFLSTLWNKYEAAIAAQSKTQSTNPSNTSNPAGRSTQS